VQMGVAKLIPRSEVLVVTTPAVNAQKVAARAVSMSRKNFLRVCGIVENMSAFVCDHGERYELFGSGGGAALAEQSGAPLLGQIPMEPSVSIEGDTGEPVALGTGPAAEAFRELARVVVEEAVPQADMAGCSARMLDAAIANLDALEL
jgi:ATP-binding protein involved in chromosome partitioning